MHILLYYIELFSFPKMHSCSVILRFRSHCIYILTINGSCWSESLMRFWLHLHLNLVYSAGDRVCLENEISVMVIISSFTCFSWEDSLCSTLWKVISYKLSAKWEGAEGELLLRFQIQPFGLWAHRKWPSGEDTHHFCVESEIEEKSPQSEMWFCNSFIKMLSITSFEGSRVPWKWQIECTWCHLGDV